MNLAYSLHVTTRNLIRDCRRASVTRCLLPVTLLLASLSGCESTKVSASPEAPWNKDPDKVFAAELGNGWREFGGPHSYVRKSGLTQPASVLARTTTTNTGGQGSVYRRNKTTRASNEIYVVYDPSDLPLREGWLSHWDIEQPIGTYRELVHHPEPLEDGQLRLFFSLPRHRLKLHLPPGAIPDDQQSDGARQYFKNGSYQTSLGRQYEVQFSTANGSVTPFTIQPSHDDRAYSGAGADDLGQPQPIRLIETLSPYNEDRARFREVLAAASRDPLQVDVYRLKWVVDERRHARDRLLFSAVLPPPNQALLEVSSTHYERLAGSSR